MKKLNAFSKELTATKVKMMSDAGLGSDIEESTGWSGGSDGKIFCSYQTNLR